MIRRQFIKESGLICIGIGMFGSIYQRSYGFVGDSPTTTDILGPFYRPGAPIRTNLNPPGFKGDVLHLSGQIFKSDGKTPFNDCMVEVWQCTSAEFYDNTSDAYLYRGSQMTTKSGTYHFITANPVPYPVAPGSSAIRPAHIHMRISGKGQQDLITQIYFKGDSHIEDDALASLPTAVNRILTTSKNADNEQQVIFDVTMSKEFKLDLAVFQNVSGTYKMSDNSVIEFYPDGNLLLMKWNGQIREGLTYNGENEFIGGTGNRTVRFESQADGNMKTKFQFISAAKKGTKEYKEFNLDGMRTFKYN